MEKSDLRYCKYFEEDSTAHPYFNGRCRGTKECERVNCPNCGAPIDIHAEKCAYCDTPYTYISRDDLVMAPHLADTIDEINRETRQLRNAADSMRLMSAAISSMGMTANEAREAFANLGRLN